MIRNSLVERLTESVTKPQNVIGMIRFISDQTMTTTKP